MFIARGFVAHDLPVGLLSGQPILVCTVAFAFWAATSMLVRRLEAPFRLGSWPPSLHVLINASLVLGGLALGVVVQSCLVAPPAADQAVAAGVITLRQDRGW